jgi:hypothetical protein
MRKIWFMVLVLLCLLPVVIAQGVPPPAPSDVDAVLMQKITQEHQNTRKFVSDELTRQREEFYKQFDDRAVFYEKEFFNTINTAVLKLSLLWAAVVFFVFGLNNLMRITLEKKRWRRVKETIKDELKAEMFLRNPPQPQPQQKTVFDQPHVGTAAYSYQAPPIYRQPIKGGYFARRKQHKMAKEIEAIEREQAKQATKAALLRQKMGGNPMPPTEQSAPQAPTIAPQAWAYNPAQAAVARMTTDQIGQMTAKFNEDLMRKYMEDQATNINPPRIPTPPQDLKVEVYH